MLGLKLSHVSKGGHWSITLLNTLMPERHEGHFADDICEMYMVDKISGMVGKKFWRKKLYFGLILPFLNGPIDKIPGMVWLMVWCQTGDKP